MKLLVCDPVDPEAVAAMREGGVDVDVKDDVTPEALEEIIPEYEAMVIRSRTKVREPLIDKASNLKAVIRAGVGLDNIDVEYAE
jgi:phosphoglycerate dehydrogenase-like enzyme